MRTLRWRCARLLRARIGDERAARYSCQLALKCPSSTRVRSVERPRSQRWLHRARPNQKSKRRVGAQSCFGDERILASARKQRRAVQSHALEACGELRERHLFEERADVAGIREPGQGDVRLNARASRERRRSRRSSRSPRRERRCGEPGRRGERRSRDRAERSGRRRGGRSRRRRERARWPSFRAFSASVGRSVASTQPRN